MSFRRNRIEIELLHTHDEGYIDDEEFLILYDVNRSTNDLPNWEYEQFDLDKLCNYECKAEFRFLKNDTYTLYYVLQFPDGMKGVNGCRTWLHFVFLKNLHILAGIWIEFRFLSSNRESFLKK